MKNIIITIAILLSINTVYGQFTVDSDGKVGINNSNPQQDLDLTGTMRFDGWTDVHFDWTHGECCGQPALYPESNWYFRLGTPTKKLGDIFATNIFCNSVTESSDENIKENITPLHSPLSKIMQINGVRYNLKSEYFKGLPEEIINKYSTKLQIGFDTWFQWLIAQSLGIVNIFCFHHISVLKSGCKSNIIFEFANSLIFSVI